MFIRKSKIVRILSVLLTTAILFSCLPLGISAEISVSDVTRKLDSLKNNTYKQGWFWCGGNIDTSYSYSLCGNKNCSCNSFNAAIQCQGFALYLAYRVIGSYPALRTSSYVHGAQSNGWRCYTASGMGRQALCAMGLQPGDIVRAAYDSGYSNGHTAVVWKVEGSKVYFAECWGNVYCKLNWGGFNYSAYSMDAILSEYSYVALWRSSSVVKTTQSAHNYVYEYEAAHPHREYMRCTICGNTAYTGATRTMPGCVCCSGTHDYVYSYEKEHPHNRTKTCRICGSFAYTGETAKSDDCIICTSVPVDLKIRPDVTDAKVGQAVKLSFSAVNAVSYRLIIKRDGAKVAQSDMINGTEYAFIPDEVGCYTADITAFSRTGDSTSVTSTEVSVQAPITALEQSGSKYFITYSLSLDETEAQKFCNARSLTLENIENGIIKVSADIPELYTEQRTEYAYSYIPLALSYGEATEFCRLLGGELALPADSDENDIIAQTAAMGGSEKGILLAASDKDNEGIWVDLNGNLIGYTNWNIAYTSGTDRNNNYLFMYPNGTWISSPALPGGESGFVIKRYNPFGYTVLEDGTLCLDSLSFSAGSVLEIPEIHEGKKVTAINASAFDSLKFDSVSIPESIVSINGSFDGGNIAQFNVVRDSFADVYLKELGKNVRYIFPFTDVDKNSWYYTSVDYCYQRSITGGTGKTTYSPSLTVTREMFITMLAKVKNADISAYEGKSSFSDVPVNEWYSAAVEWAYQNGFTGGIGDGNFGLGQNVTREQMAVFLDNAPGEALANDLLAPYSDKNEVSQWAYASVVRAIEAGLMSGRAEGIFAPKFGTTRAEIAKILNNYCVSNGI